MDILPAVHAQFSQILTLNDGAIPHVNKISVEELTEMAAQASYFRCVALETEVAGFLLAMAPGEAYQSMNYRWFNERYNDFIYIDRIIVSPAHAGKGYARRLYQDLQDSVPKTTGALTCEVNVKPVNERSLSFHDRLGFVEVGQQATDGGQKVVSLLRKPLL